MKNLLILATFLLTYSVSYSQNRVFKKVINGLDPINVQTQKLT